MTNVWLRRALHAATAGILLLIPLVSWRQFQAVVWVTALAVLLIDGVRLLAPRFHLALARAVPVFRVREAKRLSGAVWLWLGYALAVLFPPSAAGAGVLVAALADPAAAAVGERFGSPAQKSWQGSLAGLVVGIATLAVLGLSWPVVLAAATLSAILERWPGPFNDNLLVPPSVSGITALLL